MPSSYRRPDLEASLHGVDHAVLAALAASRTGRAGWRTVVTAAASEARLAGATWATEGHYVLSEQLDGLSERIRRTAECERGRAVRELEEVLDAWNRGRGRPAA
jgi:hypothetical protein